MLGKGCTGSFGGMASAGTGPTAAGDDEELDEELEAEPFKGLGGWVRRGGCRGRRGAHLPAALAQMQPLPPETHATKLLAR